MLSSSLVGRLRRIGIWHFARRVHRLVAPPICGGIHHAVRALGSDRLPLDLILKHNYDYMPIKIDPRSVTGLVPIHAGMKGTRDGLSGLPDRYRTWLILGGGWKSARKHATRNIAGRFIADGDWDRSARPFEPVPSVFQLFVEGARPEDTAEYRRHIARIGENDFAWTRGFRTEEEVDGYFTDLIRIYEDMNTSGYRTQLELGRDGADEIRVCIGRDGRVSIFGGGTHRLSMALLLQIERVPVLIKRVHSQWVADCMRGYGGTVEFAISRGVEDLAKTSAPDETRGEDASEESGTFPIGSSRLPKQPSC